MMTAVQNPRERPESFDLPQTGSRLVVNGQSLSNIPWEDKSAGCNDVIWRSVRNPIISRDLIPCPNSISNSAVVPYRDAFAGVFRVDDKRRRMQLQSGKSKDGYHWSVGLFPCAALVDAPTGRMAIYYGGADTVTCLGYAYVGEMLDFIKSNSI